MSILHIDCATCRVRGDACGDCVVSVLLGLPGEEPELSSAEMVALRVLADSGLVPPLRLVPGAPAAPPIPAREEPSRRRALS